MSRARQDTSARLASLRKILRERKLGGFLVPHADAYLNEYLPAAAERLRWLTGFSGSAGTALVLARRALLFVDGRYHLQARREVAADFEIVDVATTPPARWLAQHWRAKQNLGYDPQLLSAAEAQALARALQEKQARLAPLAPNPLDRLWHDRPAYPQTPIVAHPLRFAGEPSQKKCVRLARMLRDKKLHGVLVAQADAVAWLLNIRARDVPHTPLALSRAILYADGSVDWFVESERVNAALRRALGRKVRVRAPAALLKHLRTLRQPMGYAPAHTPHGLVRALRAPEPCPDIIADARAQKNPTEQAGTRRAHKRDGLALTQFLAWLDAQSPSPQLTEMRVADKLERLRAAGGQMQSLSFNTISAAGPHGAIVHYCATPATDRALHNNELYLCDSGAQYCDGTTDVTRTLWRGKTKPPPAIRHAYTRVLMGHAALAMAQFPTGTTGQQLDVLARRALWADGLDFAHGTGHGVGSYLGVHEGPAHISPRASAPLCAGMVLSNEPGFYQDGKYGMRIENLMLVVRVPSRGRAARLAFETLTLAPIATDLVDKKLLDEPSRLWLNRYHARVQRALGAKLRAPARAWLKRACAPL